MLKHARSKNMPGLYVVAGVFRKVARWLLTGSLNLCDILVISIKVSFKVSFKTGVPVFDLPGENL